MGGVLIALMFITFAIGIPVAFALGGSTLFAMAFASDLSLQMIPQRMVVSIMTTTLLAIPLFVLAGNLMSKGGMSKRIINFAMSLIGRKTGGLAMVAILACMIFAALSGSSSATAAAIGAIMIPEMVKYKYSKSFAGAVVASSAELGAIIPPSSAMIVYGVATGTSVTGLFMAGIVPGIMIGITLMGVAYYFSRKYGFKGIPETEELISPMKALKESFFALLMPIIILGGIYGGIFTPTEAAVVAVVYGFIVGVFVYKEIKLSNIMDIFLTSVRQSTMVLFLISTAMVFGYILGVEKIPHAVAEFFVGLSDSPIVFLLLVNILFFIIGMFMESAPAILILGPILAPIAVQYGIDPIHFGAIVIINLCVGMVTPPVGLNLYVTCAITKLKMEQLAPKLVPFLICLVADVMLITYVPAISTFLPNLLGY